jgi:hypothetical protein
MTATGVMPEKFAGLIVCVPFDVLAANDPQVY